MPSVQSFSIRFNALNDYGTFSEGDPLTGQVTLVLSKQITVESLFIKAKGDASVRWTERHNDQTHSYSASRRFFKQKLFLVAENSNGSVIPAGRNVYDFRFTIPLGSMPASFRGSHGKIIYLLEAKLCRSWKMNRTEDKEIHFVSKAFPNLQSLLSQQIGSANKEIGIFSTGRVRMDVTLDKTAYAPGETISVVAKVNNSSSSKMTPKFSLIQNVVFRAQGNRKCQENVINKVVGDCITPRGQREVKCLMTIPSDLTMTIQNCDIITVEYHLKVYLDISFAFDPKVKFPVVIIPPDVANGPHPGGGPSISDFPRPAVAMNPHQAGAFGGPSNRDFPRPAVAMNPHQAGAFGGPSNRDFHPRAGRMGSYPAGAFGGPSNSTFPPRAAAMGPYPSRQPRASSYSALPPPYPAQPARVSGGYSNPVPPAYRNPYSASSSTLHPPPTAPAFHPPPSAPSMEPPPYSQSFNISPTAPTYNPLPSAPMADFLSQSDEAPPAYSLLFPSSASENSNAK